VMKRACFKPRERGSDGRREGAAKQRRDHVRGVDDDVVADSREEAGERADRTRMLAINVSIPNLTVAHRGETTQRRGLEFAGLENGGQRRRGGKCRTGKWRTGIWRTIMEMMQ